MGSVGRARPALGYGGVGPNDFSVANAEADAYKARGEQAQQRGVQNVEYGTDRAQAINRERESRDQQAGAVAMMRSAAQGNAPSAALMLGNAQGQQSFAANRAAAAGASPQNMAVAQMNAMGGVSNQQAQIAAATMAQRSGELAQARAGYDQGAAGMLSADMGAQAQHAQQLQYEAQLRQQERQQNDAYSVQNYGAGIGLNNFAQDANNNYWKQKQDYEAGVVSQNAADSAQLAQRAQDGAAATGAVFKAAASDERTKHQVRPAKVGDVEALLSALKGVSHGVR